MAGRTKFRPDGIPDNTGKKYKSHKVRGPNLTEELLLKAIPGSRANYSEIARRTGHHRMTIENAFKRDPRFTHLRPILEQERQRLYDVAEDAIQECITQRKDYSVKMRAAFKFLERRKVGRGYEPAKQTVSLEGSQDNPINIQQDPSFLQAIINSLSINARKELLTSIREFHQHHKPSPTPQPKKKTIRIKKRKN